MSLKFRSSSFHDTAISFVIHPNTNQNKSLSKYHDSWLNQSLDVINSNWIISFEIKYNDLWIQNGLITTNFRDRNHHQPVPNNPLIQTNRHPLDLASLGTWAMAFPNGTRNQENPRNLRTQGSARPKDRVTECPQGLRDSRIWEAGDRMLLLPHRSVHTWR